MPTEPGEPDPRDSLDTRTIEVGGQTKAELLAEFQRHSISLNHYGQRLFEEKSWTTSKIPYELQIIEVTTGQLGFSEGATSAQIFERAEQLGWSLCPLEVGPFFRLQYLDQPQGYWITVASRKLSDDPGFPNGFYLRRLEDGLWLRGYTATPDHVWNADDHFVFCKPQNCELRMQIRDAHIDDAAGISQLLTASVREHISPTISAAGTERLLSEMDAVSIEARLSQDVRFFLAEIEGVLVGVSAAILPSHLYYLFVRTDYQRQGVGRRLWNHARDWILENSASETITVNSSLNAVAAYEQFGFTKAGAVVAKNHVRFQPMRWFLNREPKETLQV